MDDTGPSDCPHGHYGGATCIQECICGHDCEEHFHYYGQSVCSVNANDCDCSEFEDARPPEPSPPEHPDS